MKLYFARHGETEWNAINRILGRTDIPLNEKGKQQALELAEKAKKLPIDVILASPLSRAQETAQAILDAINVPVQTEPDLIESDFGIFEGTPRGGVEYQKSKREYFSRFPEGESFMDLAGRIYPLLRRIKEEYAEKNVLLVAHGGIGRIIENYFHDMSNEEFTSFFMENCEIREYEL